MYQNIHIRNALEYVPQSQYISLTEENKLYPQYRGREAKIPQKKKKKLRGRGTVKSGCILASFSPFLKEMEKRLTY